MHRVIAIVCAAALFAPVAWAGPENATARALVAEWKDGDPGMTLVAEVSKRLCQRPGGGR